MEKFKARLWRRTVWMALVVICAAATYFILFFIRNSLPVIPSFIMGFQTGVFVGLELILVFYIAKNLASIKNEEALRKLYIQETDERKMLIMQKTGAIGIDICYIGFALTTVAAGFLNEYVFFSMLGATVFVISVKGALKLYYLKKY